VKKKFWHIIIEKKSVQGRNLRKSFAPGSVRNCSFTRYFGGEYEFFSPFQIFPDLYESIYCVEREMCEVKKADIENTK